MCLTDLEMLDGFLKIRAVVSLRPACGNKRACLHGDVSHISDCRFQWGVNRLKLCIQIFSQDFSFLGILDSN